MPTRTREPSTSRDLRQTLIEVGASPDTEGSGPGSVGTPLCAAACWGRTETVRQLLDHGPDLNFREDHCTGKSPLDWANNAPPP
ncbi:ankyrin repeat domain-containing protein [Streptomyces chartreusis]|uniref:ankyrin repeat domain-containing protein n=1 Tax=Streptomyces chartreusis TaxID=1969 RepID=UPI0036336C85